jgi:hypothetical protein
LNYEKVEIGFKAQGEIQKLRAEKKVSEKGILDCRLSCRTILAVACNHLMTMTPIYYSFARVLISLDPETMTTRPDHAKSRFKYVLQTLIDSNWMDEGRADTVKEEYEFIDHIAELTGEESQMFTQ